MASRITGSITPGRIRKMPRGVTNTQTTFADDLDYYESDECDIDESMYHLLRSISLVNHIHL